jgi:PEGA domain
VKVLAVLLVLLLAFGEPAFSQQSTPSTPSSPSTPAATPNAGVAPQTAPMQDSSSSQATSAPPPPNTLLDGTPVKLRLAENLSSETSKTGQQVSFEVTDEVDVEGIAVIPKGAKALATVTDAEPKKRMARGGKLDVNVDSVRLADGEKVQLRAVKDTKGGGHVGAMTGAMVATSLVFFPAAPLFLFMHGKSVEIPKGTEVTAFVQGDMHLVMAHFEPVPGAVAGAAATASAVASLTVESSVVGADIEVDGSFVGNTPSTVSVVPGQHTVTVKKKGYADWSRSMNVAGSGVHLNADLEAKP